MNNKILKRRQIAIFTDSHALLEPTVAVLEDIKKRGIKEIYSLGDNIGLGPNPGEVIDLLEQNSVVSLAGNSEEYVTLGIKPFQTYFNQQKIESQLWTLSKLNNHHKALISSYPHSIELSLGGKKIALCHFANDVRFDFKKNSTWIYQLKLKYIKKGYKQFLYTNSESQLKKISRILKKYDEHDPVIQGYVSANKDPLFGGKQVGYFDAIIQGHIHWKIDEHTNSTDFYSIRAVGMAYGENPIDTASYVILSEHENGYELKEILVKFDREKMIKSILNSDCPDQTIRKFVKL